jgi:methylmalonyl-CoA mutase, C-terminal domain
VTLYEVYTACIAKRAAFKENMENSKIRVLVAKPGLDGHDRGAKVIARALRDAGFEVIYTGLHQTPEMIVRTAVDEDVHVVGMSILSGAHNALVPEIVSGLKKEGLEDALILVGGIIPDEDFEPLKKAGVHMIFTPGASLQEVVDHIQANAPQRT